MNEIECWGGPIDGKMVEYVGPILRIPLPSIQAHYYDEAPIPVSADYRTGTYERRRTQRGKLLYVWTP
jgi:hypothetical protein